MRHYLASMTRDLDSSKERLERALSDLHANHEANLQKLLKDYKCYMQEHKAIITAKFDQTQKSFNN